MRTNLVLLALIGSLLIESPVALAESVDEIVSAMCTKVEAAAIRRDRGATRKQTVDWLVATTNLSRDHAERVANLAYDSYAKDSPSEAYSECMEILGD